MKTPRLPETDSIEELARFWDTHDLTDFEDQLEEVSQPVFRRKPDVGVNIRLAPAEIKAVERLARSAGHARGHAPRLLGLERQRHFRGRS